MAKLADAQTRVAASNATPLRFGFGRLDAIGYAFNMIAMIVHAPGQIFHVPDAPVSYPFLWNIHQLSVVQWNGGFSNGPVVGGVDLGALVRNTGEVISEFTGDVQIEPYPLALLRPGYKSSVDITNLDKLEQLVRRLKPPAWPSVFPAIDETKRSVGQQLFAEHCAKYHAHLDRKDFATHVDVSTTLLKEPSASERIRGWPATPMQTARERDL